MNPAINPLLFLVLATGLAGLSPQDAAGPVTPEAASELLGRAAEFQRGDEALDVPDSLYGRFFATIQTEDGRLSLDIERWYTRAPERMLTRRLVSVAEADQTLGYDGHDTWFRDEKSGEVTVYSDDRETFDVDIEQMEEQRRLTRLLLEAVVLDALIPRLTDVQIGSDDTHKDLDGAVHPIRHVIARIPDDLFPAPADAPPPAPDDPARMIELDFGIDTESGALWTLGVTALGRDDLVPLELRFELHGPTRSGLLVPGNVKVYQVGRSDEIISLGVDVDEDGLLILEVGNEIDEAIFAVPEDEA
jgi:hypothetical protein